MRTTCFSTLDLRIRSSKRKTVSHDVRSHDHKTRRFSFAFLATRKSFEYSSCVLLGRCTYHTSRPVCPAGAVVVCCHDVQPRESTQKRDCCGELCFIAVAPWFVSTK